MSFHDISVVFDLAFRRSRLDEDHGVDELSFKSARPIQQNGLAKVEVTSVTGRKMILACNWLVFCGGMVAHGEGMSVRRAFPTLTEDELSFLFNGITKTEWEDVFGKDLT